MKGKLRPFKWLLVASLQLHKLKTGLGGIQPKIVRVEGNRVDH